MSSEGFTHHGGEDSVELVAEKGILEALSITGVQEMKPPDIGLGSCTRGLPASRRPGLLPPAKTYLLKVPKHLKITPPAEDHA